MKKKSSAAVRGKKLSYARSNVEEVLNQPLNVRSILKKDEPGDDVTKSSGKKKGLSFKSKSKLEDIRAIT